MNWFLNCVKMVYAVVKSTYYHISRFLKQKDKKGCFKLLMFIAGWYSHMCTPKLISVLSSTHAFLLLLLYRFIKLGITKNIRKSCLYSLNDTHREKLCFTQFSARMAAWLLLAFFICLHNQLSYIYSITRIRSTGVWKLFLRGFILKPTERAYILLKNGTRDFQNSPPFERSAWFCDNQWKFWTILIL